MDNHELAKIWNSTTLSASEIAAKYCPHLTRAAVLGRINRLRKRRVKEQGDIVAERSRKIPTLGRMGKRHFPQAARAVFLLDQEQCRWPIGDLEHSDFHFCNMTRVTGLSYCSSHVTQSRRPREE